jgi:hypothetical protein
MEEDSSIFFTDLTGLRLEQIAEHTMSKKSLNLDGLMTHLVYLFHLSGLASCCCSVKQKRVDKGFDLNWTWIGVDI